MPEGSSSDPSCARCHTTEGFLASLGRGRKAPGTATRTPVSCIACHDPHGSGTESQLRTNYAGDFVCILCHDDGESGYPETPHAPQAGALRGTGGYHYTAEAPCSPHQNVTRGHCTECHLKPGGGHGFEADPGACTRCHPEANGHDFAWAGWKSEIDSLLAALNDELEAATDTTTEAYKHASYNAQYVEADGSHGAHNYEYLKWLLESSLEDFEP